MQLSRPSTSRRISTLAWIVSAPDFGLVPQMVWGQGLGKQKKTGDMAVLGMRNLNNHVILRYFEDIEEIPKALTQATS